VKIHRRSGPTQIALSVTQTLERVGIRAVLTGGACASIHSHGAYESVDLDFVLQGSAEPASVRRAMEEIGFELRGNQFVHRETDYYVEFPPGPLAIGNDYGVVPAVLPVTGGSIRCLSFTDSCRDRLAAFYHFNDRTAFHAAVAIALQNDVDFEVIRRWSESERMRERHETFLAEVERAKKRRRAKRKARAQ
jgi:hypothetical protein